MCDGGERSVPLFSIKYTLSWVKASLSPLIDVFVTNAGLELATTIIGRLQIGKNNSWYMCVNQSDLLQVKIIYNIYCLFQDPLLARLYRSTRNQTWWGNPEKQVRTKEESKNYEQYLFFWANISFQSMLKYHNSICEFPNGFCSHVFN